MAGWTDDELARIGAEDELDLASERDDGTLRDPVTMWVVRAGDDLYVRPIRGRDGWFRGTRTRHEGHIRSAGIDKDVTFADADPAVADDLDAAYRAKYGEYPPNILDTVLSAQARAAAIRLVPR
ncbi:MAG TPA: DUF2255 family protein [Streptosporangiaceae bacterium]|jgi:hypothetical protein